MAAKYSIRRGHCWEISPTRTILPRPHQLRMSVEARKSHLSGLASAGTRDIVDFTSGTAAGLRPAAATSSPRFGKSMPRWLIVFASFVTRTKRVRRRARGNPLRQICVSPLKAERRSCRLLAHNLSMSVRIGEKSGAILHRCQPHVSSALSAHPLSAARLVSLVVDLGESVLCSEACCQTFSQTDVTQAHLSVPFLGGQLSQSLSAGKSYVQDRFGRLLA